MKKLLAIALVLSLTLTACSTTATGEVNVNDDPAVQTEITNTSIAVTYIPQDNITIKGRTSDGDEIIPQIDETTQAFEYITTEHAELHLGEMYSVYDVADMVGSGNHTLLFITPDTTAVPHIVFDIQTEVEAELELYEGSTTSANGTALAIYNRNRNSVNTAEMLVYRTPTILTLETQLYSRHWGSGRGAGGGDRSVEEWMLKPNTKYIIRVTNSVATAQHCTIGAIWYK